MQRLILLNNLPSLGPDPAQAGEKREVDQLQVEGWTGSDKTHESQW